MRRLLLFVTGDEQSYVFAVTADGFDWRTIPAGRSAIVAKVTAFRRGLELDTMQQFDLGLANELYTLLIGPVDALVKDKGHLLVAPSGVLTALPFHLLVTEKPATLGPAGQDSHRDRGCRALPRRRMADQAPGRQHSAVGVELAGVALARAGEGGWKADDRIWRSGVRPARDPGRPAETVAVQGPGPGVQRLLARRRD